MRREIWGKAGQKPGYSYPKTFPFCCVVHRGVFTFSRASNISEMSIQCFPSGSVFSLEPDAHRLGWPAIEPQGPSCFLLPSAGIINTIYHTLLLFTRVLEIRLWSSGLFYKHLTDWNVLLALRSSPPPQYRSLLLTLKNHLLSRWLHLLEVQSPFLPQVSAQPSCTCGIFIYMLPVITRMSYHT